MDTQKKTKRRAISVGGLSALLGIGAHAAHSGIKKVADPLTVKYIKNIRNVAGVGAAGTGLGAAYLANKYYKNKKKGQSETNR